MKIKSFLILIAAAAALLFPACASPCNAGEAKKNATAEWLGKLDAGISRETSFLGKKPSTLDYKIGKTSLYAGRLGGTKLYYSDTATTITKDSSTRKFSTTVHTEEYGAAIGIRFSSLPKQRFSIGAGRKVTHTDNYDDLTWMPVAGGWNVDKISQAEVHSNPVFFEYFYDLTPATTLGFSLRSENVKLDTTANLSVRTKTYALTASHRTKNAEFGLLLARLKANRIADNTNMEFTANRKLHKNAAAYFKAGMYTHGAPAAGGIFSDVGGQFVFSYLGGEAAFDPIFNNKIGYYSLGITVHTDSR